jgi:hypothetical protein
MAKKEMKIREVLDINMQGQSYLQVNTNQGTFLIHNKKEEDAFVRKYFSGQKKKVKKIKKVC